MNKFINAMSNEFNYTTTANGAITHKTTNSSLYDMFAMGAAMRNRSEDDILTMFKNAFDENPEYAMKCLFYIRDIRGGQGERRFFKIIMRYLASYNKEAAKRNLKLIPEYGRWDDLYAFDNTPLEKEAYDFIVEQLSLDISCKTPSLLAKWLKSENTSSKESCFLGNKTRKALHMTHKQYRKTLSIMRKRINVLERLMSEGRWDEIEFDKIPSRAGMIYKNAFAKHDIERKKMNKDLQSYEEFAKDETKKVNAKTLYPYECVNEVFKNNPTDSTKRAIINKYWENLTDYFNGCTFDGIAVVDTSGSMFSWNDPAAPINVAISLGLYCADKAKGPYANHFITFSDIPVFEKIQGIDFVSKVLGMSRSNWGMNTDIERVFDLVLNVAIKEHLSDNDIPKNIIIISDMEFDRARTWDYLNSAADTLFEKIEKRWNKSGYQMPHLVFWNVNACQNNIPMKDNGNVSFVSGMSPVIFEMVMSGKTGEDLMFDKLNSERYKKIK